MKFMLTDFGYNILTIYCRTDLAEQKMLERGDDNPIAIQRHKEITNVYDILMGIFMGLETRFDYSKKTSMRRTIKIVNSFVKFCTE